MAALRSVLRCSAAPRLAMTARMLSSAPSVIAPPVVPSMHGTTILCVEKDGLITVVGDGQVTMGNAIVVKPTVQKVRRLGDGVIAGYAGSTVDAITLLDRLERKLEEHGGQLMRAAVELSRMWRTDKYLRALEAQLLVADRSVTLTVGGNGDLLEAYDGICAIGSGGPFALAAARALKAETDLDATDIATKAMTVAADLCVFTNHNFTIETLKPVDEEASE
eukprot:PLAT14444.1.p1 GENE.PLAT14444.1~~PLAT14444.1.p1  ORF type:complete len:248 (-),score=92.69 PLAT14444.1:35-697(-)